MPSTARLDPREEPDPHEPERDGAERNEHRRAAQQPHQQAETT